MTISEKKFRKQGAITSTSFAVLLEIDIPDNSCAKIEGFVMASALATWHEGGWNRIEIFVVRNDTDGIWTADFSTGTAGGKGTLGYGSAYQIYDDEGGSKTIRIKVKRINTLSAPVLPDFLVLSLDATFRDNADPGP